MNISRGLFSSGTDRRKPQQQTIKKPYNSFDDFKENVSWRIK